MKPTYVFVFFVCYLFLICDGYKILVFSPRFGTSHVLFLGRIADTLAGAGHDVTVYQPILDKTITKNGSSNPNVKFVFGEYDYEELIMEEGQSSIWKDESIEKLIEVGL